MRYDWIAKHKAVFCVEVMCKVLGVSTSGYYGHLQGKPSQRVRRHEQIKHDVQRVYDEHHGIYGSWKIADVMQERDDLESACRNTVAAAMRELGLTSRVCKAFKPATTQADPNKRPAANLLEQDFTAERPNQKWFTDITYIGTDVGWIYLAVEMDCFSRRIVGWSLSDSLATELISDALRNAIETRRPDIQADGLLHHSDRGCQYTSDTYQRTLTTLGITCSMSRAGCCYDNAMMERFFWSLKQEWTNHHAYADLAATRPSVFQYIEMFYNRQRIHQALEYMTPEQYETVNAPESKVA